MKLVVQIPCYNEEATLPEVLQSIPRQLEGIDEIEVLVVDDGSTDRTAEVAWEHGADHVIHSNRNRGLASAFELGLSAALEAGADLIVNTDGDHQYRGRDIQDLIRPILSGEADFVIGDRQIRKLKHFSWTKRLLQRMGTAVVRWASGTSVVDATSGFRALTREAAMRLVIYSSYTYTLETIIQAGKKGLTVDSVPVHAYESKRESRLISSIPRYVLRSIVTIMRIFLMYEPLRVFSGLSLLPLLTGLALLVRYGYFFAIGEGAGHVQSVIVGSALTILAFLVFLLGLLSDLIARNRRLSEEILYLSRRTLLRQSPTRDLRGRSEIAVAGAAKDRARPPAAS